MRATSTFLIPAYAKVYDIILWRMTADVDIKPTRASTECGEYMYPSHNHSLSQEIKNTKENNWDVFKHSVYWH